jgi:hypothetical protein
MLFCLTEAKLFYDGERVNPESSLRDNVQAARSRNGGSLQASVLVDDFHLRAYYDGSSRIDHNRCDESVGGLCAES